MSSPEAGPSRGTQRLLVLASLVALLAAMFLVPGEGHQHSARADVTCGANRATLTTGQGATLSPCLSEVTTRLVVTRSAATSSFGCGPFFARPCYERRWQINGIQRGGPYSVKFADGSTRSLYRLTFRNFDLLKNAQITTQQMGDDGAGVAGPLPGYTVKLSPDVDAHLGGGADTTYTDLWVTGSSWLQADFQVLGVGFDCTETRQVDNAMLAFTALAAVDVHGCGMDIDVAFLVTTPPAGGVPNAVHLPRTTLRLDP